MIAWVSAIIVTFGGLILVLNGERVNTAVILMEVILLFSALSISLGNWMDRKTVLSIDEGGVGFRNGLRNTYLAWSEINEVSVSPSQWGKKVQIYGGKNHFSFRTLVEVKVQGELKGRFGFSQGEDLLRQIILNSGLEIIDEPGNGFYYVRK